MSMKNCFSRTERRRILYAALLYWLAFFRWARMPDGRTKDVVLILMTIYSVVLFAIVGGIGIGIKGSDPSVYGTGVLT